MLDQQTEKLQQLNSAIEQRKTEENELKWMRANLESENAKLEHKRRAAESYAQEALRRAARRDPRLDTACQWLASSPPLYSVFAKISSDFGAFGLGWLLRTKHMTSCFVSRVCIAHQITNGDWTVRM